MKRYLLPKDGFFYKANLHTHTTISDGSLTPEETKEEYKKRGYQIVAFTDHEVIVPHNDLADDNFLPITSVEFYLNQTPPKNGNYDFLKVYHINLLSKDKNKTTYPTFALRYWENTHNSFRFITEEQKKIDFNREYSVKCAQKSIDLANEEGFLTIFNHPVWSLQNNSDYLPLNGLWGIETFNSGANLNGYEENSIAFENMLRNGKNVLPVCADDSHKLADVGHAFTMVKAEKLEYDAVMTALEKGDMYSSTGPEIYELYTEDGYLHIKCSPAQSIFVCTERRTCFAKKSDSEPVTSASFYLRSYIFLSRNVKYDKEPYIRVVVKGENGTVAYSRAYYLNEITNTCGPNY